MRHPQSPLPGLGFLALLLAGCEPESGPVDTGTSPADSRVPKDSPETGSPTESGDTGSDTHEPDDTVRDTADSAPDTGDTPETGKPDSTDTHAGHSDSTPDPDTDAGETDVIDTGAPDSADSGGADPVDTGPLDGDGDGWTVAEDCDDADADVHPGAVDEVDDHDANCVDDAPVLASIWTDPADGTVETAFRCGVVASDADGDDVVVAYAWTADGAPVGSDAELAAGAASRGQTLTCTAIATAGAASSSPGTVSVVLGDAAPRLASAELSPASAGPGTELSCVTTGWYDADGDPEQSRITWFADDLEIASGASLPAGSVSAGASVWCRATPYDGELEGTPVDAERIVIEDRRPELVATVADADLVLGDLVTIGGVASDADYAATDVLVRIDSDHDGTVALVTPEADGSFRWEGTLSSHIHTLTVSATNPAGSESVTTVEVTVSADADEVLVVDSAVGEAGAGFAIDGGDEASLTLDFPAGSYTGELRVDRLLTLPEPPAGAAWIAAPYRVTAGPLSLPVEVRVEPVVRAADAADRAFDFEDMVVLRSEDEGLTWTWMPTTVDGDSLVTETDSFSIVLLGYRIWTDEDDEQLDEIIAFYGLEDLDREAVRAAVDREWTSGVASRNLLLLRMADHARWQAVGERADLGFLEGIAKLTIDGAMIAYNADGLLASLLVALDGEEVTPLDTASAAVDVLEAGYAVGALKELGKDAAVFLDLTSTVLDAIDVLEWVKDLFELGSEEDDCFRGNQLYLYLQMNPHYDRATHTMTAPWSYEDHLTVLGDVGASETSFIPSSSVCDPAPTTEPAEIWATVQSTWNLLYRARSFESQREADSAGIRWIVGNQAPTVTLDGPVEGERVMDDSTLLRWSGFDPDEGDTLSYVVTVDGRAFDAADAESLAIEPGWGALVEWSVTATDSLGNTASSSSWFTTLDETTALADADHDGVSFADGDCADEDPTRAPTLEEIHYDGHDENCDESDDDDADGDGEDADSTGGTDCRDDLPDVGSRMDEVCGDDLDQDCDGVVNGGCPEDCENGIDDDGDAFADCADDACAEVEDCLPTMLRDQDDDGWTPLEGDCDDLDPERSPSAVEDETDDVDNDCDSLVDEAFTLEVGPGVEDAYVVTRRGMVTDAAGRVTELVYDGGVGAANPTRYALLVDLLADPERVELPAVDGDIGTCVLAGADPITVACSVGGTELRAWTYDIDERAWNGEDTIATLSTSIYGLDAESASGSLDLAICNGYAVTVLVPDGGTWRQLSPGLACTAEVALTHDAAGDLYVASAYRYALQLARGTDGGTSWTTSAPGVPAYSFAAASTAGEARFYANAYDTRTLVWWAETGWEYEYFDTELTGGGYLEPFVDDPTGGCAVVSSGGDLELRCRDGSSSIVVADAEILGAAATTGPSGEIVVAYSTGEQGELRAGSWDGSWSEATVGTNLVPRAVAADAEGLAWVADAPDSTSTVWLYVDDVVLGSGSIDLGPDSVDDGLVSWIEDFDTVGVYRRDDGSTDGVSLGTLACGGAEAPFVRGGAVFTLAVWSSCSYSGGSSFSLHLVEDGVAEALSAFPNTSSEGSAATYEGDFALAWNAGDQVVVATRSATELGRWTGSIVELLADPVDGSLIAIYLESGSWWARRVATGVESEVGVFTTGDAEVDASGSVVVAGELDGCFTTSVGRPELGFDYAPTTHSPVQAVDLVLDTERRAYLSDSDGVWVLRF